MTKEEKQAYQREYYRKNREKKIAAARTWKLQNPERTRELNRVSDARNIDKKRTRNREYQRRKRQENRINNPPLGPILQASSPGLKLCFGCLIENPLENFYKRIQSKDGLNLYCKECTKAAANLYASLHRDKYKQNANKWFIENKMYALEQSKKRYKLNPEAAAESSRKWREENRGASNLIKAKYKARKRAATVKPIRNGFFDHMVSAFEGKCAYCGIAFSDKIKPEIEHFIPLKREGAHAEYNLVPACHCCNAKKHDRDPFEFLHDLHSGAL